MTNSTRDFVRSRPQPTKKKALAFARSVMSEKGVDSDCGPYTLKDGMTLKLAKAALEKHAIDASENMAFYMAEYALDAA